ncbi:hypothetical protein AWE51_23385 [Aquimarina aggregata]|uniref:DUF4347 domain-containing protein n=1 Tax=Aquimarina aggregata TaxID=1642818 RepID=A0A162CU60_9FLAO|nr:hypothetical protein [Aquimarina aggregata]KZS41099.1 hypothetical protein AWE51_23385 [Aquimarina aggregata]
MIKNLVLLLIFSFASKNYAETRTIHVFVALCDNTFQGIVPVPEKIGNGKDPALNLYWGAGYGVKSFFKIKTKDWVLVKQLKSSNPIILDRLLFKHSTKNVYLLADAYDGEKIKTCVEDFLKASNSQNGFTIKENNLTLNFGGDSDLISYVGHDGLMDFEVDIDYNETYKKKRDVIILACFSRNYFTTEIRKANANPILWTTHLMAPEAYTLKAAIDGWINNENGKQIDERAAQAYNKYQKCGIKGARNLFTTGYKN